MEPPFRLRPHARQGKAYYTELKAILREVGYDLVQDAKRIKGTGRFTVEDLCRLALKYNLNCKATCEHLEDKRVLPCGTYDRLRCRGFRPMKLMLELWKNDQGA
jgi:hypothetical protein